MALERKHHITIDEKTYVVEMGRVVGTHLGFEQDHGMFTYNIDYAFGEGGLRQGLGHRILSADAWVVVQQVIRAHGVDTWEQLRGSTVLVLHDLDDPRGPIKGLVHTMSDRSCVVFE